ncbi:hypothetical protein [Nannocystis punicea]|uniref:DUF2325 domain-containing protein n=1 Tax=Nannocystis punicea TaxID=2995304 RepID=A0ABY7HFN3_9BACT|nr:hypothetical protein [Nannocystis poenicansa]WAS98100.1 hypothetical protein O0S08_18330 [Nannocystis poenicansa]
MHDDGARWLPKFLADSGYRHAMYTHQWTEVLIWRDAERWLGRGPDRDSALEDALTQMFPSAAARQLFDRFREGLQEPARPQSAPVSAAVSAEVIPVPPASPEPELPRSPIVGRIQLPTYPAAAVAEARETLEEILKDIQDMRPDFALMSPRYQKVYMLAWISRARSFDEQFQGEHKITVLVRRIAHELTNLSKTLWPGSVQALQMNAVPACVVTELGLKTLHAPKTWAEAHEFVQNHRERAMTSEVPVDDYGWADRPRKTPPGPPRTVLREAQRAIESIAGNVTDPPPRHLTTPPEELPNDQLDALVKHAQALRDIRRFIAAEDPETWGAVMGRLRWLAGRLGERLPQLRRWLDPEFIPPPERAKTGPSADQVRQQQAAVRAERDALVAADSFDDEVLLAFLGRAFDAHNTPEVASLVQPIRPRIDALRPDLFEDRRMRRRLTGLQDVIKRGELGVLPSDGEGDLEEETDDVDDPGAHLVAQVRPKVEGKRVLFVSNREDPDLKSKLEESLGLDITWCDGNARKVQAQCESISRHSYDYVLIATGFQAHNIDGILARAARASAIPYVRVFKGRPLAVARALARSLGVATAA